MDSVLPATPVHRGEFHAPCTHRQFADKLREFRRQQGLSQQTSAQLLGCSLRSLQNWEQARSKPQGIGLRLLLQTMETYAVEGHLSKVSGNEPSTETASVVGLTGDDTHLL